MSNGNPFEGDADRTVIRPSPGGRRPGSGGSAASQPQGPQANPFGDMPAPRGSAGASPPDGGEERTQIAMPRPRGSGAPMQAAPQRPSASAGPPANLLAGGLNPLVAAATPILALAARVRTMPQCSDIEGLRERVVGEIRMFERRVGGSGLPPETLRGAHYAVCATIDDCINNTPWGSGSAWARQSMTGVFHNDVAGGERFFELLRHFHQNPGRYGDVLELMYLCLSLGMEGQFRLTPRGSSELMQIRDGLHRMLRERRGEAERELSPHWKGVDARHRPLSSYIPGWVVGLTAAAILSVAYVGFSYALNTSSDAAFAKLGVLPPVGKVALQVEAPTPPPPPRDGTLARLKKFLEPEVRQGLVTLSETQRTVTIQMRNKGVFDSGSAQVSPKFTGLVDRIGQALQTEAGGVVIAGYTDNQPIRTVRFPSNFHLSTARAEAVNDIVKKDLKDPKRLTVEGRGEADPIADNSTPEGREANRRIEFVLTKTEVAAQ
jgi:type VI secretion system protein ImpK